MRSGGNAGVTSTEALAPTLSKQQYKSHLALVDTLSTFEDVARWDSRATQLIDGAGQYLARFDAYIESVRTKQREARANHSFLARFLLWFVHELKIGGLRASLTRDRAALHVLVDELQAAIDKTPDSRAEKKAMLEDLRLAKKELNLRKREVNAAMRDVRAQASAMNARVGTGFFGAVSNPKSRRFERMSIRLAKEATLTKGKDARDLVERQIAVIDRHILWLERIK